MAPAKQVTPVPDMRCLGEVSIKDWVAGVPSHAIAFGACGQHKSTGSSVDQIVGTGTGMINLIATAAADCSTLKRQELRPQPRQIEQLDLPGIQGR